MLTDIAARRATKRDKAYKLADERGLFLFVLPTGAKSWRFKYAFGGKEKLLTFGLYPEVSLGEARRRRDDARTELRGGTDPGVLLKSARAAVAAPAGEIVNPFEAVARAWHANSAPRWKGHHAATVLSDFERDIFPKLGARAIAGITAADVLEVLRPIEARGAIDTARRIRQRMSAVFVFGVGSGFNAGDPAAIVLGAMRPMPKAGKRPAIVTLDGTRGVIAAVEAVTAYPLTKLAHRLLALTVVRPGELAGAMWDEFEDLDGPDPRWRIPAERMKPVDGQAAEHVVPLTAAALEVIAAARTLSGRYPFVFPNVRWSHRPMSGNALGLLLIGAGFRDAHVPHGWRSSFSTIMNERAEREQRPGDRAVIDLMLAHKPPGAVEAAYNRAAYMPRRRELAESWGEMLLNGAPPAAALLDGPRRLAAGRRGQSPSGA